MTRLEEEKQTELRQRIQSEEQQNQASQDKKTNELHSSQQAYAEFPWLVFKLNDQSYGVNCRYVTSIQKRPSEVVPAIDTPSYVSGLMNIRGEIVPLINTRRFFGMHTQEESGNEFTRIIEKTKEEHNTFIQLFDQAIKTRSKVAFPTDIEELSLYQWKRDYHSENLKLMEVLNHIDEPLAKLNEAAIKIIDCYNRCDSCEKPECQFKALKQIKEEHAPKIIEVLENCKQIYLDAFGDMVVILSAGDHSVGYSIDDVNAVEAIRVVSTASNTKSIEKSRFLYGVGVKADDPNESIILLLDDVPLLALVDEALVGESC